MIGALSFGGGYGMISLVRETVLGHGWLTEGEFLSFIAVSESTPGPLAINMATFIGASQGGFWGALCATLGGGATVFCDHSAHCIGTAEFDEICRCQRSSWRRSSLCGGDDPGNCSQHGAFYAGRVCSGQGRHCTGSPFHCGVPAAVGAACPLPPEKGQSTIAHWDDPALCRTGDPVLGNIRISIARCLRGILLLMTASEKCAGRFPINLSGAFCYKKPGTGKLMAPCARLQLLLEFRRCAIKLQRKKQLRWKQPQKKRPQKKRPRWKQPQKKNRSPLQQRKKRSPRPQQQQKCW